jgi:hypothetical protein
MMKMRSLTNRNLEIFQFKAPSKEYYRKLWKHARTFHVNLPKRKWCDLWHEHFDLNGFGNLSRYHRDKHLRILFHAFRLAQVELSAQTSPYQVFLNISRDDSGSDAIYVHTPNPNSSPFPADFGQYQFLSHVPPLLATHVDSSRYRIGQESFDDRVWYVVIPVHE